MSILYYKDGKLTVMTGSPTQVDGAMSSNSNNPVSNKAVNEALDKKANSDDLNNYVKTNEVDSLLSASSVLSNNYAKKTELPQIDSALSSTSTNAIQNKIVKAELDKKLESIPSEYITETELNNKGYLTEHQSLDDYALKSDIPEQAIIDEELSDSSTNPVQNKIIKAELDKKLESIPDEYITETELDAKGYLTEHQSLEDYALKSEIPDNYVANDDSRLHSHTNKDLLDKFSSSDDGDLLFDGTQIKAEAPDLSGYATKEDLEILMGEDVDETLDTIKELGEAIKDNKDLIDAIHSHSNKSVIDKITESEDGTLLFNGQEIIGGSSSGGTSINLIGYENYQTKEVVIGRWIDGRPLYRQVFVATAPSEDVSNGVLKDLAALNVKDVIELKTILDTVNEGSISKDYVYIWYNDANKSLNINIEGEMYHGINVISIMEYTKSTDNENSFNMDMISSDGQPDEATDDEVDQLLAE